MRGWRGEGVAEGGDGIGRGEMREGGDGMGEGGEGWRGEGVGEGGDGIRVDGGRGRQMEGVG